LASATKQQLEIENTQLEKQANKHRAWWGKIADE